MNNSKHEAINSRIRQILGVLAVAATWQAPALPQTAPTTEYIRAGGNLVAVLHPPPSHFTDLTGTQYPTDANLLWAEGISTGCQNTTPYLFCPTGTLTRDTMAVFIIGSLYAALQGPGQTTPAGGWPSLPQYFTDVPPTNNYYHWIEQMKYLGITSGCTLTTYCPSDPTTNAEMAVFTVTAHQYVLTGSAATPLPYPTTPQCFSDLPSTDPYFKFVQGLAQLNVIPYEGFGRVSNRHAVPGE